jgi:fructoselysine 3-epimerase
LIFQISNSLYKNNFSLDNGVMERNNNNESNTETVGTVAVSISSFVHFRYTLPEAIRRYADLGFDMVEPWGGRPHAFWEDMRGDYLKEILDALDETGLRISNFIPAQFRYPVNIATPIPEMRVASVDYLKRNVEAALRLKAPSVSLCPGFSLRGQGRESAWDAMIQSIRELIGFAPGDFLILIEPGNLWETDLIATVEDGMKAIAELGSPKNLGLCLDTGHLFINREAVSDAPSLVGKLPLHFHVDDNRGKGDDHLVPGEGDIDFRLFFSKLIRSGYSGALTVEIGFGYTPDPDPPALASLEAVKWGFSQARKQFMGEG